MTLGSLFDGIGGFPLAASRHGITPLWASEIEPAPLSITKRHFPVMAHLGDVTKINGAEIDPVDIITFGSPCQDLSVAGRRLGMEGSRSSLFFEAVRIIKEMREATDGKQPAGIIWENVPGAFSSNGREDFRTVLEEIARIAGPGISIPRPSGGCRWLSAGAVMGNGWSLAWRTMDAQYWGVPQRRRRIFLVADFGGGRAAEILFKPGGLPGDIAEGGKAGKGAAARAENGLRAAGFNTPIAVCAGFMAGQGAKAGSIGYKNELSPTLKSAASGTNTVPIICLQGSVIGRQDRNGPQGSGINEGVSFTLNATDRHAVAIGIDSEMNSLADKMGTLRAHTSGGAEQFVAAPYTIKSFGEYEASDKAKPLLETDDITTGDLILSAGPVAHCLKARGNISNREDCDTLIVSNYSVRRLTPLECERLQGFPDNWTEYGHDGKRISDSARYRALGNSVAVPCVEFILSRIAEGL